jgi:CheY-like chemotaxis protein
MSGAFSVALVGFAESESATFESFFRLAARRPPAYEVQDEVLDAQLLVVNADNAQAIHLVRHAQLQGKVLLIGHNDAGTGWPLQRKPVKLVGVLAALDELVGARKPAAPAHRPPVAPQQGADPAFAVTQPYVSSQLPLTPLPRKRRSPNSEFPPTRPMRRPVAAVSKLPVDPPARPAPVAPRRRETERTALARPGVMGVTDFGGLDALPVQTPPVLTERAASRKSHSKPPQDTAEAPPVQRGDVLLVAESLVEGRILHKRFKRYGLNIDWSREAPQALALLKAHPYRLVAIDRLKGEPDAYSVCRTAKQRKLPNGQAPVVMMFAPTAGSMDRIKAGLAGCDAYLSRSVGEAEFYKVLAQHRLVSRNGFEKTNVGF